MTKPIPIPGDSNYSHAHYWRNKSVEDDSREGECGLATTGGACRWPAEPGTPWCNQHTHAFLASAKAVGYVSSDQIRWLAGQSLSPEFTDALVRRWERFFPPPAVPRSAPQAHESTKTELRDRFAARLAAVEDPPPGFLVAGNVRPVGARTAAPAHLPHANHGDYKDEKAR